MAAYFFNSVDNSWSEAGNWFSDPEHATPFGSTPGVGDIVRLDANVTSGVPLTLDMASITLSASTSLVFTGTTSVQCPITKPATATITVAVGSVVTFGTGSDWIADSTTATLDISGELIISENLSILAGFFDVLSGGILTISSGYTVTHKNESNDLVVRVAATGTFNVNGTYNNDSFIESSGLIAIGASGILRIRTDANILEGGSITVANGGEISIGDTQYGATTLYLLMSRNTTLSLSGANSKLVIYGAASLDLYPSAQEGGTTNVINSPPFFIQTWW